MPRITAKYLNRKWNAGIEEKEGAMYYHKDGTFFECLTRFPSALFDDSGYIRFETKLAYENCSQLQRGQKLNVPTGISSIPGYVRMVGDKPL